MDSIYKKINEAEEANLNIVLATIISAKGSTPRKAGAKMIIYENGNTFGTIGGGALEKKTIENAPHILKTRTPEALSFKLDTDLNMGCGGCIDVFLEPIIGKINLLIFGAVHIGTVLAEMAIKLNFAVTLIDEREGIFDKINTQNYSIIHCPYEEAIQKAKTNNASFITIMTHAHNTDQLITGAFAKKDFAYLGMIGSVKKIAKFKKYYTEHKILTQQQMDKIDWPMGISISCQTPEEIAVSILAKLIDVRGKQTS